MGTTDVTMERHMASQIPPREMQTYHMNMGRKKDISYKQYILGTTTLERIHLEKDIGVNI